MIIIRRARTSDGALIRLHIADGKIADIQPEGHGFLGHSGCEWDAEERLILPALHDAHLHIMASLAQRHSVDLSGAEQADDVPRLIAAHPQRGEQGWLRLVGLDDGAAGLPDRHQLDRWVADQPARLQDRTGACWVVNSAGLALLGDDLPPQAERGVDGVPTGRFWRADAWFRQPSPATMLNPESWSAELSGYGITGITDASVTNGPEAAATLSAWRRQGALRQNLVMMGGEDLPEGADYHRGPLKILYDERDMPDFDAYVARIAAARAQDRAVAAHVVSEAELVLFLAALDASGGAKRGDRIEHGSRISAPMIGEIAARRLIVVSNPVFLRDKGVRYRRSHDAAELYDLYRLGSLQQAGISIRAASDAPYGMADPWRAMRAARDRRDGEGVVIGAAERISALAALQCYWGRGENLAAPLRRIGVGESAELIFCEGSKADILADLSADHVAATFGRDQFLYGAD